MLEHFGAYGSWDTVVVPDASWKPPMRWCSRHAWFPFIRPLQPGDEESLEDFFVLLLKWMGLFVIQWYVFAGLVHVFLMPRLPTSTKKHENNTVYVSQKFVAEIKSIVVSVLANIGVFQMWGQAGADVFVPNAYAELAGVIFTCFEVVDLVLGGFHGFMDRLYIAHHTIHIGLGLIIRGNCTLCFPAAILMSQETSSIFLNYYLLMRHRVDHWSVGVSQKLFALAFFCWRNGINTYGTYHYVRHYAFYLDETVVEWQMHFMAVLLVLACILQWYWGVEIVKSALGLKKKPAKKASAE